MLVVVVVVVVLLLLLMVLLMVLVLCSVGGSQAMLALFAELWPEVPQKYVAANAAGASLLPPVTFIPEAAAKL